MSKAVALLAGMMVFFVVSCSGGDGKEPDKEATATLEVSADRGESGGLVGQWQVERLNGFPAGEAEFLGDGRYSLSEYVDAETKVTRSGEYVLDVLADPPAIDLCLQSCNQPGSEYVTLLGIIEFAADDSVLIQLSTTQERPDSFSEKPGKNTLILTR